jgi:hypothetical protein
MKLLTLFLILLASFPLFAQSRMVGAYDVVLVPAFFFGSGAHSSEWETRVTVTNVGESLATMPEPMLGRPFDIDCDPPDGDLRPFDVRALCSGYASPAGVLLYVPRALDDRDVQISARVRDITRNAQSAGTEIPVVHERDFRSTEFLLTNIPADARFRTNLRIYGGLEAFTEESRFIHPGGTVGLEIYDSDNLFTPLVSTTIELAAPEFFNGSARPIRPAYASIADLVVEFPQLRTVDEYTIRIIPYQTIVDPPREQSNWAFVTITNNETQEVTTVSP